MDRKARKTWPMALLLLTSAVLMANAPVRKTSVTVHASNSSSTVSPPKDWSQPYGGSGDEAANSVVQASDGGYALAGWTDSSGAGLADFWLVKTDSAGNRQWDKTYGGAGDDEAYSVVQTSDGGYALAGWTNSFGGGGLHFWLVKTDSVGSVMWNQTYGGPGDSEAYSLIKTNDGGYAIAGSTDSSGAGGNDFWLVKTDSNGTVQWNQTYGGVGDDVAYSVTQTSDGGYALAGYTHSFGTGGEFWYYFWLVKTDSVGSMMWNQTYGDPGDSEAFSVVQTSDGGYALAGYTDSSGAGGYDFYLVKTDSAGNVVWNQTYGGSGDEAANSMVQARDGGYALAGYTDSSGAGGDDFYLVKTDSAGASSSTAGINWSSILGYAIIAVIVVIIIGAAWSILTRRGRRTDNPNISRT